MDDSGGVYLVKPKGKRKKTKDGWMINKEQLPDDCLTIAYRAKRLIIV